MLNIPKIHFVKCIVSRRVVNLDDNVHHRYICENTLKSHQILYLNPDFKSTINEFNAKNIKLEPNLNFESTSA